MIRRGRKLRCTGDFPRVDLALVEELFPALRAEWAELTFAGDGSGPVINPITGQGEPYLRLTGGRHRTPGATYRIWHPGDPEAEHPVAPTELDLRLVRDDTGRSELTLADPAGAWQVEVVITWATWPRIGLHATGSPRQMLATDAGCLSRVFGKHAEATAVLETDRLAASARGRGQLVAGTATTTFGRADLRLDAEARREDWRTDLEVRLKPKGIARLGLAVLGGKLQRQFLDATDRWWDEVEAHAASLRRDLAEARADAEEAGSVRAVLRRELWDPQVRAERAAEAAERRARGRQAAEGTVPDNNG